MRTNPTIGYVVEWITDPLDADVTISGTVTFNLWMGESDMMANVGAQAVLQVVRATDNSIVTIVNSEKGTELDTVYAAQNWTASPTSTACNRGDRLRLIVAANDVGTMAAGYGAGVHYDGGSAGVDYDSWISTTETLSFATSPSGTTFYFRDTASDINPGSAVEKLAALTRGASAVSKVTNTVSGWTSPVQWTDGGGGSVIEWYTNPLAAFTLTGAALANLRMRTNNASSNVSARMEVARVGGDGSSPTVWCTWCVSADVTGGDGGELDATAERADTCWLSGDDLVISDGQRLRLRVFIEDTSNAAMATGYTATLWYDGPSAGASGDSYITLPQSVSEYVSAYVKSGYGREGM
jgi:hypothetical protein